MILWPLHHIRKMASWHKNEALPPKHSSRVTSQRCKAHRYQRKSTHVSSVVLYTTLCSRVKGALLSKKVNRTVAGCQVCNFSTVQQSYSIRCTVHERHTVECTSDAVECTTDTVECAYMNYVLPQCIKHIAKADRHCLNKQSPLKCMSQPLVGCQTV